MIGDIHAVLRKIEGDLTSQMRLSCVAIGVKIVSRTPVKTGSLRASWNASVGGPIGRNIDIGAGTPMPARNNIAQVANSLQPGDMFSLTNNQPYARRIEYDGYSAQAPRGMVRRSAAEWQQIVDEATGGI